MKQNHKICYLSILRGLDWFEANKETLWIFYQVAAKKESYGFANLLNVFPCDVLRTIDSLWVKYSDGRFGFSVQKKIYIEVGGSLTYDYDEAFWEFTDCVGWGEDWEFAFPYTETELTYDTSAPKGHLPYYWAYYFTFDDFGISSHYHWIFSRIQTCKV
jgi:hypothetical protein